MLGNWRVLYDHGSSDGHRRMEPVHERPNCTGRAAGIQGRSRPDRKPLARRHPRRKHDDEGRRIRLHPRYDATPTVDEAMSVHGTT